MDSMGCPGGAAGDSEQKDHVLGSGPDNSRNGHVTDDALQRGHKPWWRGIYNAYEGLNFDFWPGWYFWHHGGAAGPLHG